MSTINRILSLAGACPVHYEQCVCVSLAGERFEKFVPPKQGENNGPEIHARLSPLSPGNPLGMGEFFKSEGGKPARLTHDCVRP